MSGVSLIIATLLNLRLVLRALPPYLILLAAFGSFVMWNGGVVLGTFGLYYSRCRCNHFRLPRCAGDKDNHVASIHLAQMLYIWPYFVFFSFPMLDPWLITIGTPQRLLLLIYHGFPAGQRLPSLVVLVPVIGAMMAIVHYNTVVHPFTLADNRHYMFYVFRILLRHWSIKYFAVPVYFMCAWATIGAFGYPEAPTINIGPPRTEIRNGLQMKLPPTPAPDERGNIVPFVLIWLLATSLSLVTAPLVEPRYFIIPWLIWRLHIMSPLRDRRIGSVTEDRNGRVTEVDVENRYQKHDHRLWLETAWYLAINVGTGYMFLYKGFIWPQEPGKVQRFMW